MPTTPMLAAKLPSTPVVIIPRVAPEDYARIEVTFYDPHGQDVTARFAAPLPRTPKI